MDIATLNQRLLDFLGRSPTPFHAVSNLAEKLLQAGFQRLDEGESWQLQANGKYFTTKNDSSIIAFTLNDRDPVAQGFRMVGAHTDSPCLKVKPLPVINQKNYFQLGVEVYGGVLLIPWFDRDLSVAVRVNYLARIGSLCATFIDLERPVAVIPNLAIHLNREANKGVQINPQKHILPVIGQIGDDVENFPEWLQKVLQQRQPDLPVADVLDYELFFYDVQKPAYVGFYQDFIASARLDNLLSCYVGLMAILEDDDSAWRLLVCNDHEEVGSNSACGAQGPFLKATLERIVGAGENFTRCMHHSMLISADNAHGVHPNYPDMHDNNHDPVLNHGPVIKLNANQRYATNSETSAMFRDICQQENIPVQTFVMRSDLACGSTIGPITAGEIGVRTLDVGVPTFAMHSIRELAGYKDAYWLYQALRRFNKR